MESSEWEQWIVFNGESERADVSYKSLWTAKSMIFAIAAVGGNPITTFKGWTKYLKKNVIVVAYCPAGRATRSQQKSPENVDDVIREIVEGIPKIFQRYKEINNGVGLEKYGIYGHSYGSVIAFQAALELEDLAKKTK